ncbi:MAG: LptF/LptG family permease [Longimicrobiales bacterium]
MSILIRYLIRSHVGPFIFSLTLLTGLLFLNTVAQRLDQLIGKGLPWTVLAQFALLALPHTVALTLPMSVLVAVLYAFSDLTAENEITAMTGGGVNPVRILLPLVGIGVILAGVMFLFNDKVLPESNHALKNLLVDIGRKSPTFQLREQVVNEVVAETESRRRIYYLQAARIDPVTSELEDIVIYDVGDPSAQRTTYAKRGTMAFSENQTDLYLNLYEGSVFEVPSDRLGGFQQAEFGQQFLPIKGISNILERGYTSDYRSDRELSTEMLAWRAIGYDRDREELGDEAHASSLLAVRRALGWTGSGDNMAPPKPSEQAGGTTPGENRVRPAGLQQPEPLPPDGVTRAVVNSARTLGDRDESLRLAAIRYRVEIHKKYAIAFACIVFVLLGAPLAVRFPRGGVGMVITASVVIFAIFWMSLIGGETLADRGYVSPAMAMWLPNLILLPIGIVLVGRMSRQVATARAGGWDDLLFTLTKWARRPFRRFGPAETAPPS